MNKKGEEELMDNLIYLLLAIAFLMGMILFIADKANSGFFWEDYYAKEVARLIDLSQPGDDVTIDVQKATDVAQKNGVESLKSGIFLFNNAEQQVCVKLSAAESSCYSYFNSVVITNYSVELGVPQNVLHFKVGGRE